MCDGFRYLCAIDAGPTIFNRSGKHIISLELMLCLLEDTNFILPCPLTLESARKWTP